MTDQLERDLQQLFHAEADRAPAATGMAERVRRRVIERRRRVAVSAGAAVLVAASVGGIAIFVDREGADPTSRVSDRPGDGDAVEDAKGPLAGGGMSCVEDYSPAAVAGRAFAFDGTITAIGPGTTDRNGVELGYAGVTFSVNEWFAGGSGPTVQVDLASTQGDSIATMERVDFEVGTRLLISGEPRWGGAPLDDAIAWGCGFSRYYDDATAARWRAAVR